MKKKTILFLCTSLLFLWGVTALCSSAAKGLTFEEATDATQAEFEFEEDFNFEFEANLPSKYETNVFLELEEFTEEISLDCVEEIFSFVIFKFIHNPPLIIFRQQRLISSKHLLHLF